MTEYTDWGQRADVPWRAGFDQTLLYIDGPELSTRMWEPKPDGGLKPAPVLDPRETSEQLAKKVAMSIYNGANAYGHTAMLHKGNWANLDGWLWGAGSYTDESNGVMSHMGFSDPDGRLLRETIEADIIAEFYAANPSAYDATVEWEGWDGGVNTIFGTNHDRKIWVSGIEKHDSPNQPVEYESVYAQDGSPPGATNPELVSTPFNPPDFATMILGTLRWWVDEMMTPYGKHPFYYSGHWEYDDQGWLWHAGEVIFPEEYQTNWGRFVDPGTRPMEASFGITDVVAANGPVDIDSWFDFNSFEAQDSGSATRIAQMWLAPHTISAGASARVTRWEGAAEFYVQGLMTLPQHRVSYELEPEVPDPDPVVGTAGKVRRRFT